MAHEFNSYTASSFQPHATGPLIHVCVRHDIELVRLGIVAALKQHPAIALKDGSTPGVHVVITGLAQAMELVGRQQDDARRRPPAPSAPPILVMATHLGEQEIRRAMELGVFGFLQVDCDLSELYEAVHTVAGRRRFLSSSAAQSFADSFSREVLTLREAEVIALLTHGASNKVIARELDIAIGTVKMHMKSILAKLGASSRTHAVSMAMSRGLIPAAAGAARLS